MIQSISVVIDAASFTAMDKKKLVSFIQHQQGDDDDDKSWSKEDESMRELGAPAPKAYESQSGGIVATLTEMKEKAEAQLAEERKEETKSQHNYDVLKLSLEDEIAAAKTEMAEEKKTKA